MEHLFDEAGEACSRCLGERSWGTLPTECVGYPMTEKQFGKIHDCDMDFRDGEWIELCPPMTAALVAKFGSQGVPMKSCGYEVIRFGNGLYEEVCNWMLTVRRVAGNDAYSWVNDIALIEGGQMLIRHRPIWGLRPLVFVELLDIDADMAARFLHYKRNKPTIDYCGASEETYSLEIREIFNANSPDVAVRSYEAPVVVFSKEAIRQAAQSA